MVLTKKNKLTIRLHVFFDLIFTMIAFLASYFIKKDLLPSPWDGLSITPNYYIVLLIIIITWYISFNFFDIYTTFIEKTYNSIFWDTIKAVSAGMFILVGILYITKIKDVSRILLGIFYLLDLILLMISKSVIFKITHHYDTRYHNINNILIIGSKKRAQVAINLIRSSHIKNEIIGCLELDDKSLGKKVIDDVEIIGSMKNLKQILINNVVDEVIFAMPIKEIEDVDKYILLIEMIGVKVRIFPDWHIYSLQYKPGIASIIFDNFIGIPTMILSPTIVHHHHHFLIKTIIDILFAAIALIILSPVFLALAIGIKVTSKGPIFFRQKRSGLNGRTFVLYKFRTMVLDAEEQLKKLKDLNESDGPAFKIKKDPRIIPFIGTLLRKTSLDELPQLINVFKGEMSLVGPRPPLPNEVEQYEVWQRRRLSMKPGLTCLWQIAPKRNDLSFQEWMELDLQYIDEWTLQLDIKILFKTALTVITGAGR